MPVTIRQRTGWQLLIALGAGILLARLGPFDTFSELRAPARVAYWVGLTFLLAAQILIANHLLRQALNRWYSSGLAIAAAALGAIPSAFQVAWAESLLRVGRDLGPGDLLAIYGDVILIALPLALAMAAIPAPLRQPEPLAADAGASRLVLRLPAAKRGQLLAFTAEDHYLRVFTDCGEELILMRFGDALADVAGMAGAQVHRSWWVAADAVLQTVREGERTFLILLNGQRVPVSRTFSIAARHALGLEPDAPAVQRTPS